MLVVTPSIVAAAGGTVSVDLTSVHAKGTCTVHVTPSLAGFPVAAPCSRLDVSAALPSNTKASGVTYTFSLTPTGLAGSASAVVLPPAVPEVDVSGTIAANETWGPEYADAYVLTGPVTIPKGVSVTVEPGTVVKASFDPKCSVGNVFANLCVHGTLNASGTKANPIIFTSINDNSVGGTTGSGAPLMDDWQGIGVFGSSRLNLTHVIVEYADTALYGSSSAAFHATVRGDTFSQDDVAVDLDGVSAPTISNDAVTDHASTLPAFAVGSPNLDFDKIMGNSISGTGSRSFGIGGSAVTSKMGDGSVAWQIDGSLGPLVVPHGVTLTVKPGTVVKSINSLLCAAKLYGNICVSGTFLAAGTARRPIVFTSLNDNSLGGTTGSGSPEVEDWQGITALGASRTTLTHATVAYAGTALYASSTTPFRATVSDDLFAHDSAALFLSGVTSPTISHDTVTDHTSTMPAFSVGSPSLDFSKITRDTVTGGGSTAFAVGGTAVTSTMADGAVPWQIDGTFGPLIVPSGATLTMTPGTIVKSLNSLFCGVGAEYANLCVLGTLDAVGTADDPIVFTSVNDNAAGGRTGSGAPAPGDWEGIYFLVGQAPSALRDAVFEYANDAIYTGTLNALPITDSVFSSDNQAIGIGATANDAPALAALSCPPPFLSVIDASSDWFGTTGYPAPNLDISSTLGATVPPEFAAVFGPIDAYGTSESSQADNQVPWSIYGCEGVTDTPIPLSPVVFTSVPTYPLASSSFQQ